MNATTLNRAVIGYFITIILGLLLSSLTSCSNADAQQANTPQQARIHAQATQTHNGDQTCAAITKAGTKCTRKVQDGETYCWQHGGATKAEAAGTTIQTTGTCGAITKAGTACKNRVKGGGRCHLHRAG